MFKSSRNQLFKNTFLRELAEWFIAISLKLILVKYTNIRSNRIFSDENTILLQQPWRFASFYSTKKKTFAFS